MGKRYCVITDGYVENVLVADEEFAQNRNGWVESDDGEIGARYKDGQFYNRPADVDSFDDKANKWVVNPVQASQRLAEAIDQGTDAINNLVDKAYRHVTRFQPEYLLREQQARDYKAGGCKGEAPLQVAAFAKPAGKTACEATDIIIAQADNLRMVMGKLGALRMRKFELKGLQTATEVEKRTAEILAEIKPIADKLGEVGK
ncbi:hypothetical protein [Eikenella corrodens]|uniref:hypothetical protein n=1 Tax=Eikenella corrodens TaxID=539 RepID=UPI00241DC14D|nr:hypothetical protein [Eikenella corrodens]